MLVWCHFFCYYFSSLSLSSLSFVPLVPCSILGFSSVAQMALQLHCINRWAVTGTPISRGLDDLYGLILFLQLDPFRDRMYRSVLFTAAVLHSFCLLLLGLSRLFIICCLERRWWRCGFQQPYEEGNSQPMIDLLQKIMWRNSKHNVLHEVCRCPCCCCCGCCSYLLFK